MQQEVDRIYNYLQDTGYENIEKLDKMKQGIDLKTYVYIINHLLKIIGLTQLNVDFDKKLTVIKTAGDQLIGLQKQLGYPEKNIFKNQEIAALSSQKGTKAKALSFLTWLVELTEFSTVISQNLINIDENDGDIDIFISYLCNAEDPEQLLQSNKYISVLYCQYKEFLASEGQSQNVNRQDLFNTLLSGQREQVQNLESKFNQAEVDLEKQQSKYQTDFQSSKIRLEQLLTNLTQHLDTIQAQTIQASVLPSDIDQLPPLQQLFKLYEGYQQKFQDVGKLLDEQVQQNEKHQIPELRQQVAVNGQQYDQQKLEIQKIEQRIKEISQVQSQQSTSYSDFLKQQLKYNQLQTDNGRLEVQIDDTNKKNAQQVLYQREIEQQISEIIDKLNGLQVPIVNSSEMETIMVQQSNLRKQYTNYDTQQKDLQCKIEKLLVTQQEFEHQYDTIDKQLQEQKSYIETLQKQIQQRNQEFKQKVLYYQDQTNKLQDEINEQKQKNLQMATNVQEKQQSIRILQTEYDQVERRIKGEQERLINVVQQLYQLIADSRKECRSKLEMVRHQLQEAKSQLTQWKQNNPI